MTKNAVHEETERLRQLVIEARSSPAVAEKAEEVVERLNQLYTKNPQAFTPEDIRFVNVLRGSLSVRLAAHGPKAGPFAKKAKRRGDVLDHCWRCETLVDERFTEICKTCDSKEYHWRVCPVCRACGCQRSGKMLV